VPLVDDGIDVTAAVATGGPEPTGATPILPTTGPNRPFNGATDATHLQVKAAPTRVSRRPEPPPPVDRGPQLSKAGRRRRRRWPYLLLLFVLVLGGVAAGSYLLVDNRAPSHPLPDVVNQPELEAATALRNLDFEVDIRQEYFDNSVPGLVKLQQPPGGGTATLQEGKRVTLIVSRGPAPAAVPDLAGLDEAGVRNALEGAGHVLGTVTTKADETIDEGLVLDWTKKGETPPKGATVDVVVSSGPAPRVVPDVVGRTFDDAAGSLNGLGLQAERVEAYNDDDATAGKVVAASPAAGELVTRDSVVVLTLSKGQPEVPDLGGLSADEASAALQAVGLVLGSTFGPSGGNVFLALPGEGTKVKPGSSVTVYLL